MACGKGGGLAMAGTTNSNKKIQNETKQLLNLKEGIMKTKLVTILAITAVLTLTTVALSMDHSHEGQGAAKETTEKMETDHKMPSDTFLQKMVVDGVRGEFEVMSLESMNMKDPEGATHHIMAKFFHDEMNHQIKDAVGKIKVIGPDEKEQVADLKNYSGIFAANFTFNQPGKYGVICLVKIGEEKHVFKFWYHHHM